MITTKTQVREIKLNYAVRMWVIGRVEKDESSVPPLHGGLTVRVDMGWLSPKRERNDGCWMTCEVWGSKASQLDAQLGPIAAAWLWAPKWPLQAMAWSSRIGWLRSSRVGTRRQENPGRLKSAWLGSATQ